MGLGTAIWLVLLGVLAAANLIIARKPEAKDLIDKISPYQGWIGAVSVFWGVWIVLWSVLGIAGLALWPIAWISFLAAGVMQAVLGLVLGIGVLKTFIKQPQAVAKMDEMVTRLAPKQGVLGLIAIGIGVWCVLVGFIL